jgi:hypothetical protein
MSLDKAKQKLFEEYLRWRENEGKNADMPAFEFYGWVKQNRHHIVSELELFTKSGYQEIVNWADTWERKRK